MWSGSGRSRGRSLCVRQDARPSLEIQCPGRLRTWRTNRCRSSGVTYVSTAMWKTTKVAPSEPGWQGLPRSPLPRASDRCLRRPRAVAGVSPPAGRKGSIRAGWVARELFVRQVGAVLRGVHGFHAVDPAGSLAHRQFCTPSGRIQGRGQVDIVRPHTLAEIGALASFQQVPRLQVSLRAVKEGAEVLGLGCSEPVTSSSCAAPDVRRARGTARSAGRAARCCRPAPCR